MTDALIEAVARAILASDPTCDYDICRDKYAHLPVGDYQRNWWDALHKQARNAIAAAAVPEMMEALDKAYNLLREWCGTDGDPDEPDERETMAKCKAALAKTKGETP